MGACDTLSLNGSDSFFVEEAQDLVRIFESEVQALALSRSVQTDVQAYLKSVIHSGLIGRGLQQHIVANQRPILSMLPDLPGRAALVEEVGFLCELYADLLGCPSVGLRIEVLRDAMCPRFHIDRTGIRLVCTWLGPGTEWLDEVGGAWFRQNNDGTAEGKSRLLIEPGITHQTNPFDVLLLKGSLWQGNLGKGAVHRSPTVTKSQGPRVLLALDALWD